MQRAGDTIQTNIYAQPVEARVANIDSEMKITTVQEFDAYAESILSDPNYKAPWAFAIGIAHGDNEGNLLDTFFPVVNYKENLKTAAILAHIFGYTGGVAVYPTRSLFLARLFEDFFTPFADDGKSHGNVEVLRAFTEGTQPRSVYIGPVVVFLGDDENGQDPGPMGVADTYLRLHLLSHRKVKPKEIKLDNAFSILQNVAWTSEGPIALKELPERQLTARIAGKALLVHSVDKFPRMLDYVAPSEVRIANGATVRLGAYLGKGTVVMTAGAVNFNAGTEGPNMIEGRISSRCFVGAHSDVGGGASLMGTLSGGGTEEVTLGRHTLVGANGVLGISLGDNCKVEAGLSLTVHTSITELDAVGTEIRTVKAIELKGVSGLMFYRHGTTGRVEARPNKKPVELNEVLHAHN